MVLEHAVLQVRSGQGVDFEEAFRTARPVIAAAPGCRSVRLMRCCEEADQYLLLVEWESLDAHMVSFRESADYQTWSALLHHFYDPMPAVRHFELSPLAREVSAQAHLEPMTPEEVRAFRDEQQETYVGHRIEAGEPPEVARQVATAQSERYYPGGVPAPSYRHYHVVSGGERVGSAWLGPSPDDEAGVDWLYFIEIAEAHRGRGLGAATMGLIEHEAASRGAVALALNVFGPNTRAANLYRSLGYRDVALNMRKELAPSS